MVAKRVNLAHVRAVAERRVPFVRIYSYQSAAALEQLRVRGYLTGEHEHAMYDEPYEWMRQQMAVHIPEFSGDRPVWAWLRRYDNRRLRVELTDPCVRITALVPTPRLLVSNFDMWQVPLNEGYLAATEEEHEAVERLYPDHRTMPAAVKHESWRHVLDLDFTGYARRYWQVCVDRIHSGEVVEVRTYPAVVSRRRIKTGLRTIGSDIIDPAEENPVDGQE